MQVCYIECDISYDRYNLIIFFFIDNMLSIKYVFHEEKTRKRYLIIGKVSY